MNRVHQALDAFQAGGLILIKRTSDSKGSEPAGKTRPAPEPGTASVEDRLLLIGGNHVTPERLRLLKRNKKGAFRILAESGASEGSRERRHLLFSDLREEDFFALSLEDQVKFLENPEGSEGNPFREPSLILDRRGEKPVLFPAADLEDTAGAFCRVSRCSPYGLACRVSADFSEPVSAVLPAEEFLLYHRTMRKKAETLLLSHSEAGMRTRWGQARLRVYRNRADDKEHWALQVGTLPEQEERQSVLVRVHSECLTGDLLGSYRCDCGAQFQTALDQMSKTGGILIYLRQEGRGIGLYEKMSAYRFQDQGYDTIEANHLLGHQADERDYILAAAILKDWGIRSIRLLTNNPLKVSSLSSYGIRVEERLPLVVGRNPSNERYLQTKKEKMGHRI